VVAVDVVLVVKVVVDDVGAVVLVVGATIVVVGATVVVVLVVVVVVVVGGNVAGGGAGAGAATHAELKTMGRYRSGRGHASRSMSLALFEMVTTSCPVMSRNGRRWA
jgi:hypothetical protein